MRVGDKAIAIGNALGEFDTTVTVRVNNLLDTEYIADAIDGAEASTYQNDSVTVDDSGMYMARVQNTIVTGLEILTETTTVTVLAPSGVHEVPFEGLKVLGNPVGEKLLIKSDELISQVSVFSVDGQLVARQFNDANDVNLNMTGYRSGVYLVVIQNESKYQTIKVVKE